jgi:hypothetical protein
MAAWHRIVLCGAVRRDVQLQRACLRRVKWHIVVGWVVVEGFEDDGEKQR